MLALKEKVQDLGILAKRPQEGGKEVEWGWGAFSFFAMVATMIVVRPHEKPRQFKLPKAAQLRCQGWRRGGGGS